MPSKEVRTDRRPAHGATYDVETVDIGLINPSLESISYLFWRSDDSRPHSSNADVFGHRMLRPLGRAGGEAREVLHSRLDGIALYKSQFFVVAILPKIDARPSAE